MSGMESSPD